MSDLINQNNLQIGAVYIFTTKTQHLFDIVDGAVSRFRYATTFMILGIETKKLKIFILEECRTTRISLGDSPVLKKSLRLCRGF